MRKYHIGIIDLVTNAPAHSIYDRILVANYTGIMPQVIAIWCEQQGHKVSYFVYTGFENLMEDLPDDLNIVFISAFTCSAQLAYALSNMLRSKNIITILGGPHARSYPQDARKYFDYVAGLSDKALICDILADCAQYRPLGIHLASGKHPETLPGIRERWNYIKVALQKSYIKIVPVTASFGCPYTCEYCVDAEIPYRLLDLNTLKEDLIFVKENMKKPRIVWCDPNFGIQFNPIMNMIEEADPGNRIEFIAESNLSLLTEDRLKRFKKNGFKAMLVGVESWFEHNRKSKSETIDGENKVSLVSGLINQIQSYIPYVQSNFILGLDIDTGIESFRLTKRFVDMTPGVFPAYCLFTVFGTSTEHYRRYQNENRIIPFAFHLLSNNTLNIRPLNFTWQEFYRNVIDLTRYSFSPRAVYDRFRYTKESIPAWLGLLRALTFEGIGRLRYYSKILQLLQTDRQMIRFYEQESTAQPEFYINKIKRDLGNFWNWLPSVACPNEPELVTPASTIGISDGRGEMKQ